MHGFLTGFKTAETRAAIVTALVFVAIWAQSEMHSWTWQSGETIDAEYVSNTLDGEALLQKSNGEQIRIPLEQLSAEDRDYIAMKNPPSLTIDFSDSSKVETLDGCELFPTFGAVVRETVQFKVRIKKADFKDYPFSLTVEYYAIGYQYQDQDKYVLLDRGRETFAFSPQMQREVEFSTKPIFLPLEFTLSGTHFGAKYSNYVVLVFDELGELITHAETKNWLFKHREDLRKLPRGAFFDDTCARRHASGPKANY